MTTPQLLAAIEQALTSGVGCECYDGIEPQAIIRELMDEVNRWERAAYEALGEAWSYGTSWTPDWYDVAEDFRLSNPTGYARKPE